MSTKPAPSAAQTAATAETVPATQYERFLAALPESFRKECRSKLDGSGLAANHPAFLALAELYEKDGEKPARDFILEATLHADQAAHLLNELKGLPAAIIAVIQPQLHGLLAALNSPLQKLEAVAAVLPTSLPIPPAPTPPQAVEDRPPHNSNGQADAPKPQKKESKLRKVFGQLFGIAGSTVSNCTAWIVTGSISAAIAVMIFSLGAAHLAHAYEAAYQARVAHMEADSAADTVALSRLLTAGINLKVEESPDKEAWYLILPGAHKAAQPVDSPEGLAVEVWP